MPLKHWVMLKHSLPIRDNKGQLRYSIPAEQPGIITAVEDGKGLYICFPQGHTTVPIPDLLPITMPDVDMAIKLLQQFQGHHCKAGQFQFNIKFHAFPPQKIYDECGDGPTSDEYNELLSRELEHFMEEDEGIVNIIEWVDKKWHTAGRSGGWLVVEDVHNRSWSDLAERYEEAKDCIAKTRNKNDRKLAEQDMKDAATDLIELALGVRYIGESIRIAKVGLEEYVQTDEPWEQLRERCKEEDEDYNEDYEEELGRDSNARLEWEPDVDGSGSESEDAGCSDAFER